MDDLDVNLHQYYFISLYLMYGIHPLTPFLLKRNFQKISKRVSNLKILLSLILSMNFLVRVF